MCGALARAEEYVYYTRREWIGRGQVEYGRMSAVPFGFVKRSAKDCGCGCVAGGIDGCGEAGCQVGDDPMAIAPTDDDAVSDVDISQVSEPARDAPSHELREHAMLQSTQVTHRPSIMHLR